MNNVLSILLLSICHSLEIHFVICQNYKLVTNSKRFSKSWLYCCTTWHLRQQFLISFEFTWQFSYKNRFWLSTASLKIACLLKHRMQFSWEIIKKTLWLALIDLCNIFGLLIGLWVAGFLRTRENLFQLT